MKKRTITVAAAAAAVVLLLVIIASVLVYERGTIRVAITGTQIERQTVQQSLQHLLQKTDKDESFRLKVYTLENEAHVEDFAGRFFRGADIVVMPAGWHFDQLTHNTLKPLASAQDPQDSEKGLSINHDTYPEAARLAFSRRQKLYAVPITWVPCGIFYVRRHLEDGTPPEQFKDYYAMLTNKREDRVQPLIMPGYDQGRLFDTFIALYSNQPDESFFDWFASLPEKMPSDAELETYLTSKELPSAAKNAREQFQQLLSDNLLIRASREYDYQTVYEFLNRNIAATTFADTGFIAEVPSEDRRQFTFGPAPMQGPRRPRSVGRLLGAAVTNSGDKKPAAAAVIQHLGTAATQEKLASESGGAFFAANRQARYLNRHNRRAARILSISSEIFPSRLTWANQELREELDRALQQWLLP